jgi:hypothetical protein
MPSCPTRSSETHVGDSWFPPCKQNGTLGAKIRMRQWARQDPFVRGASFPAVVIHDQPRLTATDLRPALFPCEDSGPQPRSKAQGCPGAVGFPCFTATLNAAGMLHSDSVHDRRAQRYRENTPDRRPSTTAIDPPHHARTQGRSPRRARGGPVSDPHRC